MPFKHKKNARDQQDDNTVRRFGWRSILILLVWIGFIFGTSCTVIRPHEFFALVQKYAMIDEQWMRQFQLFWGVSWFIIVKGWHFAEFVILTLLCVRAINWWRKSSSISTIVMAMVFCIVFAISDEWHQTFVPDRHGTVMDVLIDSLGVFTAGLFLLLRHHRKEASKHQATEHQTSTVKPST